MKTDTDLHYPNEVFDHHLEMAIEFAITWLKDGDCQDLMPHLMTITLDGQGQPQITLMALALDLNARNKYGLLFGLGADFAGRLADGERLAAVFGIFESWVVISQEKVTGDLSKHPDRQEIVSIGGLTTDGRHNAARINIVRSEQGTMLAGDIKRVLVGDNAERVWRSNLLMAFDIGVKAVLHGRGLVTND